MKTTEKSSSGVGFFSLLGILFIGLKLADIIAWSWWLVTAPLWGPMIIIIAMIILTLIFCALTGTL